MFPLADFSKKKRVFRFDVEHDRADIGCCSGYRTMQDGRKCISETTIDRLGDIYETYFFSNKDIEHLPVDKLFEYVKAAHLHYEHDNNIKVSASTVIDCLGESFWALDVCIVSDSKLIRKRPPFFDFYHLQGVVANVADWQVLQRYTQAQKIQVPFLLIEGETGSASWRDNHIFRILDIKTQEELTARLQAYPNKYPSEDYCTFNVGIFDARDLSQPFNETVYHSAEHWKV